MPGMLCDIRILGQGDGGMIRRERHTATALFCAPALQAQRNLRVPLAALRGQLCRQRPVREQHIDVAQ